MRSSYQRKGYSQLQWSSCTKLFVAKLQQSLIMLFPNNAVWIGIRRLSNISIVVIPQTIARRWVLFIMYGTIDHLYYLNVFLSFFLHFNNRHTLTVAFQTLVSRAFLWIHQFRHQAHLYLQILQTLHWYLGVDHSFGQFTKRQAVILFSDRQKSGYCSVILNDSTVTFNQHATYDVVVDN